MLTRKSIDTLVRIADYDMSVFEKVLPHIEFRLRSDVPVNYESLAEMFRWRDTAEGSGFWSYHHACMEERGLYADT